MSTANAISNLMLTFQHDLYKCRREQWEMGEAINQMLRQHGYTAHHGRQTTQEDLIASGLLRGEEHGICVEGG